MSEDVFEQRLIELSNEIKWPKKMSLKKKKRVRKGKTKKTLKTLNLNDRKI